MKEKITLIETVPYGKYGAGRFNRACPLCGEKIELRGFDFFLENTGHFVCKQCTAERVPGLIEIQENALRYGRLIAVQICDQINLKLANELNKIFVGES